MLAGKGGKNRRRGKNEGEEKRELILREEGQVYAKVVRMLGNGRLEAHCFESKDGKEDKVRQCHIRGKMRKKVSPAPGRSGEMHTQTGGEVQRTGPAAGAAGVSYLIACTTSRLLALTCPSLPSLPLLSSSCSWPAGVGGSR